MKALWKDPDAMNTIGNVKRLFILFLLLFSIWPKTAVAQNQTNDPLVSQQQYLFDVHKVDQAWSFTTGSFNTKIGIYSMLGFLQNHEDLSASRLLAPQGDFLVPDLDYASEVVGIVGAKTNNGVGMAGIDHAARLQSYSVLRRVQFGDKEDNIITFQRPGGALERYYLDLHKFADLVNQGRANGIGVHLFAFGVPSGKPVDFPLPSKPKSSLMSVPEPKKTLVTPADAFFKSVRSQVDFILNNSCGAPYNILGDCLFPPDPLVRLRTAVGNAVALDGAVVVAPAGDLEVAGEQTIGYLPAMFDKFAIAVGGLQYQGIPGSNLIKWERTKEAFYVDVAGFAEDVVGFSGTGNNQYNTEFGGTAAAAAIGGGVAALLKAENPSLSGEDVEEILKRTADDVGDIGRDNATGFGAINAGRALAFVRNNDIQRESVAVSQVLSNESTGEFYALHGLNYQQYNPFHRTYPFIRGELRTFRVRVRFTKSFAAAPDVWIRWSQSDGIDSAFSAYLTQYFPSFPKVVKGAAIYDPFDKALRVVSVDANGFTVEGKYWFARFYNALKQQHPTPNNIPKNPAYFTIAYTAVGTEGSFPLNASISGPSWLGSGQQGTWTANVSGGKTPYRYSWDYQLLCGGTTWIGSETGEGTPDDPTPSVEGCGQWHYGGSSATYTKSTSGNWTLQLQLTVTDSDNPAQTKVMTRYVDIGSGSLTRLGETAALAQETLSSSLLQLPATFVLEPAYPNPFNPETTIRFALPEASEVRLVVYDVMGREVVRLVDQQMGAGEHGVNWDASHLPSGTYLYRITAGSFTQTKSMVLMK